MDDSMTVSYSLAASGSTGAVAAAATALEGLAVGSAADGTAREVTPAEASYLPFEVVVRVLQQVPQQQRLTVCASVCKTWAAAAVAASSTVQLSLASTSAAARHERTAGLSKWLQLHAEHLRDLQLTGNYMSRPRLQLPMDCLQQLKHLLLTNCRACFACMHLPRAKLAGAATASTTSTCSKCGRASGDNTAQQTGHAAAPCAIDSHLVQLQQQQANSSSMRTDTGTDSSARTSSSCPCCAPPAAALVSLQLQGCVLEWGPGLPAAVSLQNLQQLSLQQLLPGELSKEQQQALQLIVPAAFQQMTQLTQLVLKQLNQYESVVVAGLAAGLGGMQQLRELQIDMLRLTTTALTHIPSSITLLELAGAKTVTLSSSALPNLTKLTGLQQLFVEGVGKFEPRLLSGMQGLKSLRVRSSSSRFVPDGFLGTQDLLVALRGLTQLQTLDLRNILQHLLPEEQMQLYAGLTASSLLQQLDLSACRFPPKSGLVVLQAASSLPYLQRLVLYRCEDPPGSVLQLQDLDSLVECCPVLEDLAVWVAVRSDSTGGASSSRTSSSSSGSRAAGSSSSGAWQDRAGLQLQPLLGLSALTRLVVAGPGVTSGELPALAQLRQLSSLAMYRCSPLTDAALLGLTQLTALMSLAVDAHSCVSNWPGVSEYLYLQGATAGHDAGPSGGPAFNAAEAFSYSNKAQLLTLPRAREAFVKARLRAPVWQQLQRLVRTGSLFGDVPRPSGSITAGAVADLFSALDQQVHAMPSAVVSRDG